MVRLAHEILERSSDLDRPALVAIRRRRVPLAARLARKMGELEGRNAPVGSVDIQHHRDDLSTGAQQPVANAADIPFNVNGKDVVLVAY